MTESEAELRDVPLETEIVLVGEMVAEATASDGPLSPDEIDRVLGVD